MKILICTDGSKQSQKALVEASKIARGCNVDEVAIIYVYESKPDFDPSWRTDEGMITREDIEQFKKMQEKKKEEKKQILLEASRALEDCNIKARTIFKEGHPSETISRVASEEGFDMIVIGSRGFSGLKKLFLGSVSNAVAHEASANVLIVK